MIVILFGKTGSGKSFAANILHAEFGFRYLEGDDFFTKEMMAIIIRGGIISQEQRDEFVHAMITETIKAEQVEGNVVLAQLFLSDKSRQEAQRAMPNAIWLHIEVEPSVRFSRLQTRKDHFANAGYARKMDAKFEPISIEYQTIDNNYDTQHVRDQLIRTLGLKRDQNIEDKITI